MYKSGAPPAIKRRARKNKAEGDVSGGSSNAGAHVLVEDSDNRDIWGEEGEQQSGDDNDDDEVMTDPQSTPEGGRVVLGKVTAQSREKDKKNKKVKEKKGVVGEDITVVAPTAVEVIPQSVGDDGADQSDPKKEKKHKKHKKHRKEKEEEVAGIEAETERQEVDEVPEEVGHEGGGLSVKKHKKDKKHKRDKTEESAQVISEENEESRRKKHKKDSA